MRSVVAGDSTGCSDRDLPRVRHREPHVQQQGADAAGVSGVPATKDNVERADAVFAKLRDLRARVQGEDADWFARFDAAVAEHRASGVLPQDALLAEAVVADAEFLEVMREKAG